MNRAERALRSLSVIRCGGRDAEVFLQGQLTNDVSRLDDRTQLAACATPQGRVLGILRLRRSADAIHALLPAELAAPLLAHLRKFVLRSKVDIDVLDGWSVNWAAHRPEAAQATGSSVPVAFDYPDGRTALARPTVAAADDPVAESLWLAADVAAGLPQVAAKTSGHFVPQMLNLDLLDAISFTKGCYTGQEIVARTQNLGRIKRRTFRYSVRADEAPAPLTALHHDGAKAGEVLMSSRVDGGIELLAVVALEARDRPLRTGTGHTALPLALPYSVP